jgi:hypothetical protein
VQPSWSTLVPAFEGPTLSPENGARFRAAQHTVPNIVASRGYRSYVVDGFECTLDYFNPGNELDLRYRQVGEEVLVLLLQGSGGLPGSSLRDLRNDLVRADALFEVLRWIDRILAPEWVVGTYSLAAVLLAYRESRIDADIRPWEFFYHLTVLRLPQSLTVEKLRAERPLVVPKVKLLPRTFHLARVDGWLEDRVLLLATAGFWPALGLELPAAAAIFGKTSFQEALSPVRTFHRGPNGEILSHRHRSRMDRSADNGGAGDSRG